jgi:hypothetical protein
MGGAWEAEVVGSGCKVLRRGAGFGTLQWSAKRDSATGAEVFATIWELASCR